MDEILQFIALEAVKVPEGIKTTITVTPAAIDLIKKTYGVDREQLEETIEATIDQNQEVWDSFDEEERDFLIDNIIDQIACEQFVTEEMGIDDYIYMEHVSNFDGEVHIVVVTRKETGYI